MSASTHPPSTDRLYFTVVPPVPPLAPYVREFRVLRSHGPLMTTHQCFNVPDGSLELLLNFGAPLVTQPRHQPEQARQRAQDWFIGPVLAGDELVFEGVVEMVNISFWPGAGYLFLRQVLSELSGQWAPADALLPAWFRTELPQLAEYGLSGRIARLQGLLARHLPPVPAGYDVVRQALHLMRECPPDVTVTGVRRDLGFSERRLQRTFRHMIGLSPGDMIRLVRFWYALDRLMSGRWRLVDAALDSGYYDQAHWTNDFRQITGLTPRQFRHRWPHIGIYPDDEPLS